MGMTPKSAPKRIYQGMVSSDADELRRLTRRNCFQQMADWVFGYDFFISYRWSDGRNYALSLAEALKRKDYNCFLDTEDYQPGSNWVVGGQLALRNTTRLIFICTRDAVEDPQDRRGNEDPIIRELSGFSQGARHKVRILLHDIPDSSWEGSEVSNFFRKEDLFLNDAPQSPSKEVLEDLDRGCRLEKRDRRRLRIISSVCCILFALAVGLFVTYRSAAEQRDRATHNFGVSKFKEAERLAGESRKWEAVCLIAQTLVHRQS